MNLMEKNIIYPSWAVDIKEGEIIIPAELRVNIFGIFESEDMSYKDRVEILKTLTSYIDDVSLLKELKKEIAEQIKAK